ncbi:MAG TPA: FtsX-like permease family protein [Chitinivibrionales bacterium]|nr:FtsX-like permease family protein [Chitinivibrionales bacterium]
MELLSLSWRNIWRNKRRTLITAASIFSAVFLALIMRAMQLGSYDKIVRNVVEFYTGYIQVHAKGYWDDKSLDRSFIADTALLKNVENVGGVSYLIPRLESFALASTSTQTKGVLVVGAVLAQDDRLTHLSSRISKGIMPEQSGRGVLVAEGAASDLGVAVGDSIVLLGQGFHGMSAAGAFPVSGIVHFGSPDLNSRVVYMPLSACQDLYSAPQRITSLVVAVNRPADAGTVAAALSRLLAPASYEVMTWDKMLLEVVQQIQSDNMAGLIMLGILYAIVIFGIFGTITMMTIERRREFGMVLALGMSKTLLVATTLVETIMISIVGIAAGMIAATPVILYFHVHPIRLTGEAAKMMAQYGIEPVMPFLFDGSIYGTHAAIVLGATLICALFPLWVIGRLKVAGALRS